jgi:hypothetical protein
MAVFNHSIPYAAAFMPNTKKMAIKVSKKELLAMGRKSTNRAEQSWLRPLFFSSMWHFLGRVGRGFSGEDKVFAKCGLEKSGGEFGNLPQEWHRRAFYYPFTFADDL